MKNNYKTYKEKYIKTLDLIENILTIANKGLGSSLTRKKDGTMIGSHEAIKKLIVYYFRNNET